MELKAVNNFDIVCEKPDSTQSVSIDTAIQLITTNPPINLNQQNSDTIEGVFFLEKQDNLLEVPQAEVEILEQYDVVEEIIKVKKIAAKSKSAKNIKQVKEVIVEVDEFEFTHDTTIFYDDYASGNYFINQVLARPKIKQQNTVLAVNSKIDMEPGQSNPLESKDWMLGVILVSLFVLGWLRMFYSKTLGRITQSVISYQVSYKLFKEKNALMRRVSFVLNVIFLLNLSLFITQLFNYYQIQPLNVSGSLLFSVINLVLIFVYLSKYVVYKISGFLFLVEKSVSEYLHSVFIFNKTFGLAMFPITIGVSYVSESIVRYLIIAGIGIAILFYILRIIRGLQVGLKIKFSIFYLILYLCILEILPMLLFYKMLTGLI